MPRTAREVAEGKKVKKPKSKTKPKPKKDWKAKLMDVAIEAIPGGKKIEKAMKERTGGKSMREKHYPKKK